MILKNSLIILSALCSMNYALANKPIAGFPEYSHREYPAFKNFLETIRKVYETSGFPAFDTRLVEHRSTIESKGIDGKEIYFLTKKGQAAEDSSLALRFDLTLPLARYVSEHPNETFPIYRHHIARVYRGETPQDHKGRHSEFYQADIDIIGSESLDTFFDAHVIATFGRVFDALQIPHDHYTFRINNRKFLEGFLAGFGIIDQEKYRRVVKKIDDLEKEDSEKIVAELAELGLHQEDSREIFHVFQTAREMTPLQALEFLMRFKHFGPKHKLLKEGLEELSAVIHAIIQIRNSDNSLQIDPGIARGLDYYTGTVFETKYHKAPEIGSICSGGAYENLVSDISSNAKKHPGVGGSIGVDRLFSQLMRDGIVNPKQHKIADIYVIPCQDRSCLPTLLNDCNNQQCTARIADPKDSLRKALKAANSLNIPYAVFPNVENDQADGRYVLKDMTNGGQKIYTNVNELISAIKDGISIFQATTSGNWWEYMPKKEAPITDLNKLRSIFLKEFEKGWGNAQK